MLTNTKAASRRGKVQLIDATGWYQPLRKNMGKKNCELGEDHIQAICQLITAPQQGEQSKIFPNEAFSYHKVSVERPLRLAVHLDDARLLRFHRLCVEPKDFLLSALIGAIAEPFGTEPHYNYNTFMTAVETLAKERELKLTAKNKNTLRDIFTQVDEMAELVISKTHKPDKLGLEKVRGAV